MSQKCIQEALELFDLTIADPKHKNSVMLKELIEMRPMFIDHFMFDNNYKTEDLFWHNYFLHFNYAYAIERGK